MRNSISFIAILFFIGFELAPGQVYPVQSSIQLVPPYSLKLNDYITSGEDRIVVNLLLSDLQQSKLDVYPVFTISGSNIRLSTNIEQSVPPITLYSGIPTRLAGYDLLDYLSPENLDCQGLDQSKFIQSNGSLPEGFYRFELEIREYQTDRTLAHSALASAWLILNEPPIINQPKQNEVIRATLPQLVNIHWTPRHLGSPNSILHSTYRIELFEIIPENVNPEYVVVSTEPIFTFETNQTFYVYGPAAYPLVPGQKYAIRIKANSGNLQHEIFRNEGYSQIRTFVYGSSCLPPQNIKTTKKTSNSIKFLWDENKIHSEYEIKLRHKNEAIQDWHTRNTYSNEFKFSGLKPASTYEYMVQSICGDICSNFSKVYEFTTLPEDTSQFICKSIKVHYPIEKSTGTLQSLSSGDVIKAGDFNIQVSQATSQGKLFSGNGNIYMPLLENIKIPVTFEKINLSKSGYLTKGNIVSSYTKNKSIYEINSLFNSNSSNDSIRNINTTEEFSGLVEDSLNNSLSNEYLKSTQNSSLETSTNHNDSARINASIEGNGALHNDSTSSNNGTENVNGKQNESTETIKQELKDTYTADNEINFGPVTYIPNEQIKGTRKDNGWLSYEQIMGQMGLTLRSGKINKSFLIKDVKATFDKDTTGSYRNVSLQWDGNFNIGEIYIFSAKLKTVTLEIDKSNIVSGTVTMEPYLSNDFHFGALTLKKGITGLVNFSYEETDSFEGNFDLSSIENLNISFEKQGEVIANIKNVRFDDDQILRGLIQQNANSVHSCGPASLEISNFLFHLQLNFPEKKLSINEGSGSMTLYDVPGVNGKIGTDVRIINNQYFVEFKKSGSYISVFGMELSKPALQITIDSTLQLHTVKGSFNAKHPKFNSTLEVPYFQIEHGTLKKLSALGEVGYRNITLTLTNSSFEDSVLCFDASVKNDSKKVDSNVAITGVRINSHGDISLEEISTDLVTYLGPVKIEFKSRKSIKERRGEGAAKVYLNITSDDHESSELILSEAMVIYKRDRKGNLKEGSIEWNGNQRLRNIGYLNAEVQKVYLEVEQVNEKEIIKGSINLSAYLDQDKKINDYILLRKGIHGDFNFHYNGEEDNFKGKFDFNGVTGINIDIIKSEKNIASLKNGSFNEEGIVQGTLVTENTVSYSSNGFSVAMEQLELNCSLNALTRQFRLLNGKGKLSVKNIKGMKGIVSLDLIYDRNNVEAVVQSEKSELEAFSMKFSDLTLTASFDSAFNFSSLEGSVSAKHDDFDVAFAVHNFKISEGQLQEFQIEGTTSYRGFTFDLRNARYNNKSMMLSAKVAINASGNSAWFDVDNFRIDSNGTITVGKISGDLNLSKMHIAFNATFSENAFKGKFSGDFLVLGFDGIMDIGATDSFNYSYLALDAKTNIPFLPGFKITDLGGKIGYNYYLDFSNTTNTKGRPRENNYVAGFKLGVGDNANMFAISAEPTVQFGNESFEFLFNGNLNMPRRKPIFNGKVTVCYKSLDNSLSGNFSIDCKIPNQSGRILRTDNINLQFYRSDNKFMLEGTNMSATVLSLLTFEGNVFYERTNHEVTGEAVSKRGSIDGIVSYGYDMNFEYDWKLANISGGVNVDLGATMSAQFDDSSCMGEFGGRIDVGGSLKLTALNDNFSWKVTAIASSEANITYTDTYLDLNAEAEFAFETTRSTYYANYNFDKRWDLN